jgi:hypothetical protein
LISQLKYYKNLLANNIEIKLNISVILQHGSYFVLFFEISTAKGGIIKRLHCIQRPFALCAFLPLPAMSFAQKVWLS